MFLHKPVAVMQQAPGIPARKIPIRNLLITISVLLNSATTIITQFH
jgi:hypothetical protein